MDNGTSQSQQAHSVWKKLLDDHIARTELAVAEAARLQEQLLVQNKIAIDEAAKFSRASLDYAAELAGEWRKLTLEATRRVVDFATPKV